MENKKDLPVMLETPEKETIGIGLFYAILCFYTLPFLVMLSSIGLWTDPKVLTWFELVYHIFNFCIVVAIFREYLQDAFYLFPVRKKQIFSTVKLAVLAILAVMGVIYLLVKFTQPGLFSLALYGTLPLSEMDIMLLSADIVYANPVIGTLIMMVLSPVVSACLYYAIGFSNAFNVRPWLGYVAVAVLIAIPRIINANTQWDPTMQKILYCNQLPMHLIACWTYRRTDSILAPIFTLTVANGLACARVIILLLIGQ